MATAEDNEGKGEVLESDIKEVIPVIFPTACGSLNQFIFFTEQNLETRQRNCSDKETRRVSGTAAVA